MADLPTIIAPGVAVVPDEMTADEMLDLALSKLSPVTRLLYQGDWARFMAWSAPDDLRTFLSLPVGRAAQAVNQYMDSLTRDKKAPATRKRALQAIRKMVRIWFVAGVAPWQLPSELLQTVKVRRYKDVTGISADEYHALLAAVRFVRWSGRPCFRRRPFDLSDPPRPLVNTAIRDLPILLLLHDSALRRREVATLDLGHYVQRAGTVDVWEKRMAEGDRIPVPITNRTVEAIEAWLDLRGRTDGPLFTRLPLRRGLESIDGDAVAHVSSFWCRKAGIDPTSPHQLRHTAITRAAEKGASAQDLMDFARHADFSTTKVYIDGAASNVRGVAEMIAEEEHEDDDT